MRIPSTFCCAMQCLTLTLNDSQPDVKYQHVTSGLIFKHCVEMFVPFAEACQQISVITG